MQHSSIYIRNVAVAQTQNPYASYIYIYGLVGYAQAMLYITEIPGNFIEETQNCIAVPGNFNPNVNVAHSFPNKLVHWRIRTERRLARLRQHIFLGAAIIESLSPTNDSATKVIVELFSRSGADVY
ncbi:9d83b0b0-6e3d-44ea-8246-6cadad444bc9 [Sclerotinia trifoliorum]|uniref:9d83b0b0-6e3d-44ea-8246-6cadad444bc9 n=1 Tax=Sclerotinia trifoliorum TaxID=28548 RepID=A0A8H2VN39_9HELO|nr:9d83b0b0-6e3d-44ea-8246-6cadad444bc9 [Sclerotinia trifoliorum]